MLSNKLGWGIWVLTLLGTIIVYPSLPPVMQVHFGLNGRPNGFMGSLEGAFILPFITLIILLIFTAIPHIDPLKANIQKFRTQYDIFVALLIAFFAATQVLLIAHNLGSSTNPLYIILPAAGILIFYAGFMLPQTKRNWFIGIRTPWTISSDYVWEKTHKLGGTLFKILGVLVILTAFEPEYAPLIVVLLIAISLFLVVYSYIIYTEEQKV